MIEEVIKMLGNVNHIYLIGNGGSASTCSHFANDLRSHGYRAMSLVDNVAIITKIANDTGYEYVFEEQLETLFTSDDVLIAISASGNSPNLIKAVEYANKLGTTIAIVGFDGGQLAKMCTLVIHTETNKGEYEIAEDKHLAVCHTIAKRLGK
uniref:Putative SIS domain-containing protein n=1 Tax=viral metagenome TaxID=1070528 RepID=A0A6M3LAS6_9ZZZZ